MAGFDGVAEPQLCECQWPLRHSHSITRQRRMPNGIGAFGGYGFGRWRILRRVLRLQLKTIRALWCRWLFMRKATRARMVFCWLRPAGQPMDAHCWYPTALQNVWTSDVKVIRLNQVSATAVAEYLGNLGPPSTSRTPSPPRRVRQHPSALHGSVMPRHSNRRRPLTARVLGPPLVLFVVLW